MAGLRWPDAQELLVLLLGLLLVCYLIRARMSNKLPPGPSAWSLLANLFSSDRKPPHIQLEQYRKRYGDVMTLYILWMPIILLSGFQTIQEALIQYSKEFAGRPRTCINDLLTKCQGIIFAPYGRSWKQQRRFTLTILRSFGLGTIAFEEKILEEAKYLIDTLKASLEGQAVDPRPVITSAVSNVTCMVIFGRRFHYEDKTFIHLVGLYDEMLRLQSGFWMRICSVFPIILYLPGPQRRIFENQAAILTILRGFIEQHRETLSGETIRDFIDAYLLEMEKERDGSPDSMLTEGNLLYDIHDLFLGGTETTTTTLYWGLLYMMAYPDIQVKCQKEIDEVIGRSRRPSMEDGSDMPYVSAVIHEVQRYANILPVSVARAMTQDTTFMGHTIKKDTLVLINLYSALTDEGQWKHPHQFNPENFLNDSGEFFKPDAFIPFSMGIRACLGERLAKMELFLLFTSLLQHLEFHWPHATTPPNLEGLYKIMVEPQPYEMLVRRRETVGDL
ncbi:cytochrome P450 2D6-like [Leucoraja erinacea]|uniref:cytochrome P450 2D6-like n=1 Tax=Leucoraja erinaceus TaxID=7782 RepID=UPI002454FBAA|nr:cytochrome P450 2D6-like [Leucoraja erinacea]